MSRRLASALISQITNAARSRSSSGSLLGMLPEAAAAQNFMKAASYQPVALTSLGACSVRALSTSGPSLSNLLNVLKEEIKHEKEAYQKPSEIASGPPAPFTLTESSDGDTLLTLKRSFNGEEVFVDLHVNDQPEQTYGEENANEDGEALNAIAFNVTVTKQDHSLVFECESDGTYVTISHLTHEPKQGGTPDSYYSGPVFAELDEALQTELRQYLQDRGVTEELGEYLRHLVFDKEQREYMAWLEKVQNFIK